MYPIIEDSNYQTNALLVVECIVKRIQGKIMKNFLIIVLVFIVIIVFSLTSNNDKKSQLEPAKLVSDVRTVFDSLSDKINSNLEDLDALHQTVTDKKEKISWMSKEARLNEEQRLKELSDGGMILIAQIESDLSTLDSTMTSEIASIKLASSGILNEQALDEQAEDTKIFIQETKVKIREIKKFLTSLN